jgi:hypothetical protein
VANVAKQHELYVNETYPTIQPSYWQSITAESGGTRLQSIECARLVIGSVTGNHMMFIGGLDDSAPYSGRGLPLYAGPEHEREMFIENANRISVCASFSGELVYYMGYVNGSPTQLDPSTQGAQPNNEPPILIRTDPLNGQLNVPFRGSGINFVAIFNENIASGTVDTSSMSIRISGNFTSFLSGFVDYFEPESVDDRTKIAFTPASGQLIGSSYYNVFIGKRIADDFGSTLPSTLTWSFVTAGIDDSPMFLRTNIPISGTTLTPFSQTIEATFSKTVSGTVNNTGYTNNIFLWNDNIPLAGVSGVTILAGDSSGTKLVFTPIALLQPGTLYRYAISGVLDQFDQFAAPLSGIAFSTGPSDTTGPIISGLTPNGAYPSLSGVLVNAAVSGNVSTLINIAVTFNERISGIPGGIISGQVISLVNSGALATNLSGVITLDGSGRIVTFDPVAELISGTAYQIRISGVMDVNGNIITQTDPSRSGIAFRTWVEADTSPPIVQSITPISGSVGQAVNSNIVVTFNETLSGTHPANPYTAIIAVNLSGTGDVAGTATTNTSGTIVTFDPTADLSGDRTYFVSVSGALDLASNRMSPISGHPFRTIDNIAPIISGTVPMSGAVDVATNTNIDITFSEALSGTAAGSVTADVVRFYKSGVAGTPFAGARTLDATRTILTFNPTTDLDQNEHYQFGVSGIRDVSGNQLVAIAANSGISFVTQGGPIITSTTPTSGSSGVALNSDIVVVFNKALSGTPNGTITAPVFRLWLSSASPVALGGTNTLNADSTQLTFNPTADLLADSKYVFAISGVRDLSGNIITQVSPPRSGFMFSTLVIDTTPPSITSTVPTSGATGVLPNTTFIWNFSEEISGTSGSVIGTSGTVRMWLSGVNITTSPQSGVHGVVIKSATNQALFTPNAVLSGNKVYLASISGIFDLSGGNVINQNPIGGIRQSGSVFTVVDNIAPTVLSISPSSGSTNVVVSQNVTVTMSEPISGTVGTGTLTNTSAITCLNVGAGTLAPGTVNLDATKTILTFDPTASLQSSTSFDVRVSGLRDTSDNFMVPVSGHRFTTAGPALTTFFDNVGTTEANWASFNPDKTRMGILRQATGSVLNGVVIKRASFKMRRIGTSATTVFCRIFENTADAGGDAGTAAEIGSIAFNDIPDTAGGTRVIFENLSNSYAMTTDDAIAIEWTGTQSASVTLVMYFSPDNTDGEDTCRLSYDGEWAWLLDEDADAKLEG